VKNKVRLKKYKKLAIYFLFVILIIGLFLPLRIIIPVSGANSSSWNADSFWYYPWGQSGVHKGIDIFAGKFTKVVSPVYGWVVSVDSTSIGGNALKILGPQWTVHYFAHLETITVNKFELIKQGTVLGEVGNTGNATGKPPHLHYSIFSLLPRLWLYDGQVKQGYLKMFYLNPQKYFAIN